MDIKDLIKWLILCFRLSARRRTFKVLLILTILCSNTCLCSSEVEDVRKSDNFGEAFNEFMKTLDGVIKTVVNFVKGNGDVKYNLSGYYGINSVGEDGGAHTQTGYYENHYPPKNRSSGDSFGDGSIGESRTFGRPLKKLSMALIPLAFKLGAASTWLVVIAILAFKSVLIGLALLMFKVAAVVAKIYSLTEKHGHHEHHGWSPHPQKEIHLHIHNNGHGGHPGHSDGHSDHWSRDDAQSQYNANTGPQTINTPYGSYVRVGPPVTSF